MTKIIKKTFFLSQTTLIGGLICLHLTEWALQYKITRLTWIALLFLSLTMGLSIGYVLRKKNKNPSSFSFLLSLDFSIHLFFLFMVYFFLGACIPQYYPISALKPYFPDGLLTLISFFQWNDIFHSSGFYFLSTLLIFGTAVISAFTFSTQKKYFVFSIMHVGILFIFAGALIFLWRGGKGIAILKKGGKTNEYRARAMEEQKKTLPFFLQLDHFYVRFHPPHLRFLILNPRKEGSFDLRKQTEGKLSASYHFRVMEAPREIQSPRENFYGYAAKIKIDGPLGTKDTWIYSWDRDPRAYPDDNLFLSYVSRTRDVKNYVSHISLLDDRLQKTLSSTAQLNYPASFQGYKLYQASYDPEHFEWSGILIIKDPGLPLVYIGFFLVLVATFIWFFQAAKEKWTLS